MTEYKPGIYSGPRTWPDGVFDPNVLLIKEIYSQTENTLYGKMAGISESGYWESNMSTFETDTLIAPWVLSKWS